MPLAVYQILTDSGSVKQCCRQQSWKPVINRRSYFVEVPPACELRLLAWSIVALK
ncbi:MAG: hypothetical protein K0Q64_404 [Nitrobacter vulgaris]|jgi:hypothetical protein|nr:hypothetical protein [Nitrobacter vulgaris]